MTVTTARTWVRQFGRNSGDSTVYTDADVDRAIQMVCARFSREARYTKVKSDMTLTASSAALPTLPTGFLPDYIISAWLRSTDAEDPILSIVAYDELLQDQANSAATGYPTKLAFSSSSAGEVWPTPSGNYAFSFLWWKPFTLWTPGSDPTTVLDLPDAILAEILPYGPPAVLQHNEPEHDFSSASWKKYLEVEARLKGAGRLGLRVINRESTW